MASLMVTRRRMRCVLEGARWSGKEEQQKHGGEEGRRQLPAWYGHGACPDWRAAPPGLWPLVWPRAEPERPQLREPKESESLGLFRLKAIGAQKWLHQARS